VEVVQQEKLRCPIEARQTVAIHDLGENRKIIAAEGAPTNLIDPGNQPSRNQEALPTSA
jgi:hypothetical protein